MLQIFYFIFNHKKRVRWLVTAGTDNSMSTTA